MVGFIFTEFIEMVENYFGYETVDRILLSSELDSNGIFTSASSYPDSDFFKLIEQLSKEVDLNSYELEVDVGKYLFKSFLRRFAPVLEGVTDANGFITVMNNHFKTNFSKIYPNDKFGYISLKTSENQLTVNYRTDNKLTNLIEGIILGSFEHYHDGVGMIKEDIKGDGRNVNFIIKLSR